MDKIYTVAEVAKILRVNKNFVYNEIKTNKLKSIKLGSIKIKESDLEKYINKLN